MSEVVALPQQGLTCVERERVGEAIAEIQPSTVTTSLAEVEVRLPGQSRVTFGHWLDDELRFPKQFVKAAADYGVSLIIEHYSALEIACGRESSRAGVDDRTHEDGRVFLGVKDRDDGRCIDNHFGSPRSS